GSLKHGVAVAKSPRFHVHARSPPSEQRLGHVPHRRVPPNREAPMTLRHAAGEFRLETGGGPALAAPPGAFRIEASGMASQPLPARGWRSRVALGPAILCSRRRSARVAPLSANVG